MKKNILFILATCLLFICTACGSKELSNEKEYLSEGSSANLGDSEKDSEKNEDSSTPITVDDVRNHEVSPESDFFYTDFENGGLIILKYQGSEDIVVIPETIKGKPVTAIEERAFTDAHVKGIKIADSVTTIEDEAFALNDDIEIVICGAGLKTVGESAFQGCGALRELELNEGLESLDRFAFGGTTALKSVVIPASVTKIEGSFFATSKDFKIIGKAGSVAETYATEASITFEAQ